MTETPDPKGNEPLERKVEQTKKPTPPEEERERYLRRREWLRGYDTDDEPSYRSD